ncbi:MAG: LLM class F420-dependent oxidoreductase [Candidatus Lambdaproteobacteria bacterium]|nr:LLM class F420-dependent oxidoreductase [Candidatus Lambdaproteobacteria bacterium]
MKIGVCLLMTDHGFDFVGLARRVEALGFESLWAPEHGVIPVAYKTDVPGSETGRVPVIYQDGNIDHIVDPFVWLGAVAVAAPRLVLGTGICLVPEHNPIHLAKQVATVDRLAGGRFLFGIGAGWLRGESEVFGVDFPRRWRQTQEHVAAMKTLWSRPIAEYHGEYVSFPPVICDPKPLQRPHPPILIAGEQERVAERIVDYGDGWLPRARHTSPYQDPALLGPARRRLETLYRQRGREPGGLTITMWDAAHDRQSNRRFFEAGADRVVHIVITGDEPSALRQLDTLAERVL